MQGSAADIIKLAMQNWTEWADRWNLSDAAKDALEGGKVSAMGSAINEAQGGSVEGACVRPVELLAQIHDELLFECKEWAFPQVRQAPKE